MALRPLQKMSTDSKKESEYNSRNFWKNQYTPTMPTLTTNLRATVNEWINLNQGRDYSDTWAGYVSNIRGFTDDRGTVNNFNQLQVTTGGIRKWACFVRYEKFGIYYFMKCELTTDFSGAIPNGYVYVQVDNSLTYTGSQFQDWHDYFTIKYGEWALPTSWAYYPLAQVSWGVVTDLRVPRDVAFGQINSTWVNVTWNIINNGVNITNNLLLNFPSISNNYTVLLTDNVIEYVWSWWHTITLPTWTLWKIIAVKNLSLQPISVSWTIDIWSPQSIDWRETIEFVWDWTKRITLSDFRPQQWTWYAGSMERDFMKPQVTIPWFSWWITPWTNYGITLDDITVTPWFRIKQITGVAKIITESQRSWPWLPWLWSPRGIARYIRFHYNVSTATRHYHNLERQTSPWLNTLPQAQLSNLTTWAVIRDAWSTSNYRPSWFTPITPLDIWYNPWSWYPTIWAIWTDLGVINVNATSFQFRRMWMWANVMDTAFGQVRRSRHFISVSYSCT